MYGALVPDCAGCFIEAGHMICIREGKNGSGKTLLAVSDIVREFVMNERDIVASVPLMVLPWCTRRGKARMGLRAYLRLVFPKIECPPYVILRGSEEAPLIESFGSLLVVLSVDIRRYATATSSRWLFL